MAKAVILSAFLLFSFASQAQMRCSDLINKNFGSNRVFEGADLLGLEMLSAAILASRIGRGMYEGLTKTRRSTVETQQALLDELSPEARNSIIKQLQSDIFSALTARKGPGFEVKLFVKKGLRSRKTDLTNIRKLNDLLDDPSASRELKEFIAENIDAIIKNALKMPMRGRLRTAWQRRRNRAAVVSAVGAVGSYAYWIYSFYSKLQGVELADSFYMAAQLQLWAPALYSISATSGTAWSALRNKTSSPVFDFSMYDQSLGLEIRNDFSK